MKKYIDVDLLKNEIFKNKIMSRELITQRILHIIDNQPTADVAEVVHGKWLEDDYGYFRCSECGSEQDTPEYTTPFCPLCGAKMDAEQEKNA